MIITRYVKGEKHSFALTDDEIMDAVKEFRTKYMRGVIESTYGISSRNSMKYAQRAYDIFLHEDGISEDEAIVAAVSEFKNRWIKTDDMQYMQKIDSCRFYFVEARYAEDKYLICKAEINLADYMDDDGEWDKECQSTIKMYYESFMDLIQACHGNEDTMRQLIAEMIFETMSYTDTDYKLVSEDEVDEALKSALE